MWYESWINQKNRKFSYAQKQYLGTATGKINIHIFCTSILMIHILIPSSVLASFYATVLAQHNAV